MRPGKGPLELVQPGWKISSALNLVGGLICRKRLNFASWLIPVIDPETAP